MVQSQAQIARDSPHRRVGDIHQFGAASAVEVTLDRLLNEDGDSGRDDAGESGFAQAGRTVQQHVIHSLAAALGGFNGDGGQAPQAQAASGSFPGFFRT